MAEDDADNRKPDEHTVVKGKGCCKNCLFLFRQIHKVPQQSAEKVQKHDTGNDQKIPKRRL